MKTKVILTTAVLLAVPVVVGVVPAVGGQGKPFQDLIDEISAFEARVTEEFDAVHAHLHQHETTPGHPETDLESLTAAVAELQGHVDQAPRVPKYTRWLGGPITPFAGTSERAQIPLVRVQNLSNTEEIQVRETVVEHQPAGGRQVQIHTVGPLGLLTVRNLLCGEPVTGVSSYSCMYESDQPILVTGYYAQEDTKPDGEIASFSYTIPFYPLE